MIKQYNKGEQSEWNEGEYKSLRLHQAQDLINKSKINPLQLMNIEYGNKFGYEIWFLGIDILFGEGFSKYADSEKKEVDDLKEDVINIMEKDPPCTLKKSYLNGDYHTAIILNKEKWRILKDKIEEYEYLVKYYNDKHGLSTRNIGTKGLF